MRATTFRLKQQEDTVSAESNYIYSNINYFFSFIVTLIIFLNYFVSVQDHIGNNGRSQVLSLFCYSLCVFAVTIYSKRIPRCFLVLSLSAGINFPRSIALDGEVFGKNSNFPREYFITSFANSTETHLFQLTPYIRTTFFSSFGSFYLRHSRAFLPVR